VNDVEAIQFDEVFFWELCVGFKEFSNFPIGRATCVVVENDESPGIMLDFN
jgi:hypothetical protein